MARPLSQSIFVLGWAALVGAIATGFGINAVLRPVNAMTWFEIAPPPNGERWDEEFFQLILPVYGSRNILIGLTIILAAYNRHSQILGFLVLGFGALATVDGFACWRRGVGEWNHWGYAPQLLGLSTLVFGLWDGVWAKVVSLFTETKQKK